MTTRQITHTVNTIETHPNKAAVYAWINANWHDLAQHSVDEFVCSLKVLAEAVDATLDYSISAVPDRGEFITLKDMNTSKLKRLKAVNCELTGVCYDNDVIHAAQQGDVFNALSILHLESEYIYSDEALYNMCEANAYEFHDSGEIV